MITCYMCAAYGQRTPATTSRHGDIGTLTTQHGTHPVCDECAAEIDAAGCEACEEARAAIAGVADRIERAEHEAGALHLWHKESAAGGAP